jgi:hypothetical protein
MSIKVMLRVCSVAVLFLLVLAALGPAQWVPRSGLGWRIDHFIGYFAFTLTFCIAWPRVRGRRGCRGSRFAAGELASLYAGSSRRS